MSKEVAKKEAALPSVKADEQAVVSAMISEGGNTGFETVTAADMTIPFISLIQALSKCLRGANKIKEAEEGDFLDSVTKEIIKPPFRVVPCAYKMSWVEWTPDRSNSKYIATHNDDSILKQCDTMMNGGLFRKDNGNAIVPTASHFVLRLKDDGTFARAVINLSITQLKKSKRWNTQMRSLQIKVQGRYVTPSMFSHIYTVTSVDEQNDKNSWKGWEFGKPELILDMELYRAAKAFNEDCMSGLVKVQEPQEDTHTSTDPVAQEHF